MCCGPQLVCFTGRMSVSVNQQVATWRSLERVYHVIILLVFRTRLLVPWQCRLVLFVCVCFNPSCLVQCLACSECSIKIFVEWIHAQHQRRPYWPQVNSDLKHSNRHSIFADVGVGMVVVYNLFFHWLFLFTFPQSLSLSLLCASFLQFMVYGRLPVFIIIPVSWSRCKNV